MAAGVAHVEVKRRRAGDEEQQAVLQRAFNLRLNSRKGILPVVADVLVEGVVVLFRHLVLVAQPDGLHRVQRLGGYRGLFRLGFRFFHHIHLDGVRHEIGVLLNDAAQFPLRGVVGQSVFLIGGLEVQGDGRAGFIALGGVERVGAIAGAFPLGGTILARAARHHRHAVGHHEHAVEADAELTDEVGGDFGVLRLFQAPGELLGAGLGDGADQVDQLVAVHADAVVPDGERAGCFVCLQANAQLGAIGQQLRLLHRLETALVQRVGSVGDQLAQEDVLVRIDGMNHEVQKLPGLGLELIGLSGCGHGGSSKYRVFSQPRSISNVMTGCSRLVYFAVHFPAPALRRR